MTAADRRDDVVVNANWLSSLGRFKLQDLGLLVALIMWLVIPRPDTDARASIATVKQDLKDKVEALDTRKQNKEASELQYRALSDKIDGLAGQIKTLNDKLDRERK